MADNIQLGRVRRVFPYCGERYRGFAAVVHDRFLILEGPEDGLIFLYSSAVHKTEAAARQYPDGYPKAIAGGTIDQRKRTLAFLWPTDPSACRTILHAIADIAVLDRLSGYSVCDCTARSLGLLKDYWQAAP